MDVAGWWWAEVGKGGEQHRENQGLWVRDSGIPQPQNLLPFIVPVLGQ